MKSLIHIFRRDDGKILTEVSNAGTDYGYPAFGLMVCDLVRHIAKAFHVHEDKIWEWVEKERDNPTTALTQVKPS